MSLQQRSKWHGRKPNLRINDLVLLTDETAPRKFCPLAIVTEVKPDEAGNVRTIVVKTSGGKEHERDVQKVALLERDGEENVVSLESSVAGAEANEPQIDDNFLSENVETGVSSVSGADKPQIDVDFLSNDMEPKHSLRPRKNVNYR